ncbi:MAG TPA: ATP-binding protein [Jatrophihabitans sp.]|jgi:hypothetical protein|nr:ATP-binding protein [Jatrophihabitans sp.]
MRASFDIPATPAGPAGARHAVAALLPIWGLASLIADAELVVSELVTNAIQHAPGTDTVELELVAHADWLHISLADGSVAEPTVAELDREALGGRGMRIVAALGQRWGAEVYRGGKRVWVDLVRPDGAIAPRR